MSEHCAEVSSTRLAITSLCSTSHPSKRSFDFDSICQNRKWGVIHDTKKVERTSLENSHSTMCNRLRSNSHDSCTNIPVQHSTDSDTRVKLEEPPSNRVNKISLPSFRESFPFAVRDAMDDYSQPHLLSTHPLPLRPRLLQESIIRPVFNFKVHCSPRLSNEPSLFTRRLDYGRANSEASSSTSSHNGSGADTSRATSVCSRREISPSGIKTTLSSFNAPRDPDVMMPSVEGLLVSSKATTDREDFLPVANRARTNSYSFDDSDGQRFCAANPVVITRSPGQTPLSLSLATWSNALPASTSMTRPRRSRASHQTRQDWQNHAMREAEGSWRCTWTEGELTCTYKSKKQATKRHIELKHMKMKPHSCCYCERTFGQRTTLDVHMATHTGQKDHVCPDFGCTEKYSDASRLLRHRVIVHGYIVRKTAPKQLNCLGRKPTPRKKARPPVSKH